EASGGSGSAQASWTKDITIEEPFTPTFTLNDHIFGQVSISSDLARPVSIDLTTEESVRETPDSQSGDISTDVSIASLQEDVPEGCGGIQSFLEDWNTRARGRAEQELEEGLARYAAYRQKDSNDFSIYLTSWISLQIGRADTQLFSCIEEVYRYNREYEADFYEIHGKTINSKTGEALTLHNFFTDMDALCEKAGEMLLLSGMLPQNKQAQEALGGYLKEAIEGCRDDGSFAWMATPEGIEFHMIIINPGNEAERHYNLEFFLPFAVCKDFLSQDTTMVSYPYLQFVTSPYASLIIGKEVPAASDGSGYYQLYLGSTNGHKYLYGNNDEHTDIYKTDSDTLYLMGSILGEIAPVEYTYDRAYTPLDPQSIGVRCLVQLEQELFLEGIVRMMENGMLERIGLFELTGNGQPITTAIDLEAEIFPNETATESAKKTLPMHSSLAIIRSDGETFIDCQNWDSGEVIRLYITGSEESGWLINGLPKDEVVAHEGFWEE
ncbi:MAG: hypothetical protein J6P72_01995, partial [Firmicutes bacterium]|nr:hypothetical protein [Bacillota bacterium]